MLKYEKLHIVSDLGPSPTLLKQYNSTDKQYNDWIEFKTSFINEINSRDDIQHNINKIIKAITKGLDIYLICYERNYNRCHRTILAEYISNKTGYEWKEF